MTSPEATRDYLRLRFAERPNEIFVCLYLDNKHRRKQWTLRSLGLQSDSTREIGCAASVVSASPTLKRCAPSLSL
jgi:DNA repair protein RadC